MTVRMVITMLMYMYCCFIQVDGLSLLVASLRHWVSKGEHCPAVLVSTHFHSVTQQKLLPTTPLIEYQVEIFLCT